MGIADEKYVALTTFRRNGERKATAVWIVEVGGEVGFTTGADSWKLRRLRNDPRVELQACNARGDVTEGSTVVTGRGREASAEEFNQVRRAVKAKYGLAVTMIGLVSKVGRLVGRGGDNGNTAVLITLD